MDIVFIHDFELTTQIGVFAWEHHIEQKLILDLDLAWPNQPPAQTDDIHLALDYSAVVEFIQIFASSRQFELLETFAEELAALLIKKFNIEYIKLKIRKPGAIKNAVVGVQIERRKA
ncbi:dihydroneopterin aldolase [Catenovulum sp. 2E275]|uniref:dihydroneopterin aldolase n=1 Tax=Catenovulum sp. 2E275 TaxID=2980497 RepID=UPI0021D09B95|nr:dihydroneopterin aldolase [Catenovulum sp. 2E275]MCU4674859.1 dihydroneopterin aldolase [Catenovulum sp. 2E275]